jgi:hypothetical protein
VSRDFGKVKREEQKVEHLVTLFLFKLYTSEILTIGMPDYPASRQSGTGLKKTNDAGAVPVPE